jgi:Ca-activated chloride channel family protein
MNWTLFHFLRPYWLLAVVPGAILILLFLKHKMQRGSWLAVCDEALLPYILQQKPTVQSRWPLIAASLAGVLTLLALAGPTWERVPAPAFRNETGLVIALDLSRSMEASDIKPTRLVRARYKIADILKQRKDGQTALLVYTGEAFTVTPLTNDNATIASQLEALTPDIMPSAGSNTLPAVLKAVDLLRQAGLQKGQILLVTDGVANEEIDSLIKTLGSYRLSVLGIGTEEGAPIPLLQGGFLKDEAGNIITPKLPTATLQQLAQAGGGLFQAISDDDSDIKTLLATVDKSATQNTAEKGQDNLLVAQWEEKGVYLLWLIAPLVALQFRRGLLLWALLVLVPLPKNSYALGWQDLWQTPDQQAQQAFNQKHYGQAAEKFENPRWKAAAYYQAKDYAHAAQASKNPQTADDYYNQGNALAQSGELEKALAAYQQALKLNPKEADTLYNKKVVEEVLKKQQQQKDQQKQQDKQEQDKQKQQKSDSPQKPSQQNQSKADNTAQNPADAQQQAAKNQKNEKNQNDSAEKQAQTAQQTQAQHAKEQAQAQAQAQQIQAQQDEKKQANAQWLNRIPDDPAGLLRRKFKYQYSQQPTRTNENGQAY